MRKIFNLLEFKRNLISHRVGDLFNAIVMVKFPSL